MSGRGNLTLCSLLVSESTKRLGHNSISTCASRSLQDVKRPDLYEVFVCLLGDRPGLVLGAT
jgi:hypothetical protein